jgi:hypothetical protein
MDETGSLYPASTEFRWGVTSPEAKRDVEAEYKATLEQLPLLKQELTRLEERIKQTDSISYALTYAKTNQISDKEAMTALNHVATILAGEKSVIEEKVKAYSKRMR